MSHPALFFFLGALLLPLFQGKGKKGFILLIPVLAIIAVALAEYGIYGQYHFLDVNGVFGRVDKLSLVFAWVFVIMAFLGALYALHPGRRRAPHRRFLLCGKCPGGCFCRRLPHPLHLLGDHGLLFRVPHLVPEGEKIHRGRIPLSPCSMSSADSSSLPG